MERARLRRSRRYAHRNCPKHLPKPLAIAAAKQIGNSELREGEAREPWIIARDSAVIALLYGCGLRISEALGLRHRDCADRSDTLTDYRQGQ